MVSFLALCYATQNITERISSFKGVKSLYNPLPIHSVSFQTIYFMRTGTHEIYIFAHYDIYLLTTIALVLTGQ